jgi:hypothetical protein
MSHRAALLLVVTGLFGQEGRLAAEVKPRFVKPSLGGTVVAVAADGKTLTLEMPTKKGQEPARQVVKLTPSTQMVYANIPADGKKPAIGYQASVWLVEGSRDTAAQVKLAVKEIILLGIVKEVSSDGTAFDLEGPPRVKGEQSSRTHIRIPDRAKVAYHGIDRTKRPPVGAFARVWLRPGSADTAAGVVFGASKADVSGGNPKPGKKKGTPGQEAVTKPGKKPPPPALPRVVRPARDIAAISTAIDTEVDRRLKQDAIPASPRADDAEFLRRVTLDLTGRIPTHRETIAFLDSKVTDRRARLIDELLDRPEYGRHFATLWRNLLAPPPEGSTKYSNDTFGPWLADRFEANFGWDRIVSELLTVEGPIKERPHSAFVFANGENFQPQPNLLTASVARLFWGVQLGCAECHDHPFAKWKQDDFWAIAAFFSRFRFSGFKGGQPPTLNEAGGEGQPTITIPASAGKAAGRSVPARFLDGTAPRLDGGPLRPTFAAWATGPKNPYFARAAVNRLWAHFFGRGIVNPVDNFDAAAPSHPDLLRCLEQEFVASGFDQKHLIRCITNSRAYQRTSRPAAGNEKDDSRFSRMALKVLTPEAFHDSVAVVTSLDATGQKTRSEFVRFFRAQGDGHDATVYLQSIPQLLRLLNSQMLDSGAPVIDRLCATDVSREEAVATLFLTALSRRPTPSESRSALRYLERRGDRRSGYRGVLWALLNSSEFAINH